MADLPLAAVAIAPKPPARRATTSTNLSAAGISSDFAAVEQEYSTRGPSASSAAQADSFLSAMTPSNDLRYDDSYGASYGAFERSYGASYGASCGTLEHSYGADDHAYGAFEHSFEHSYGPPADADVLDRLSALQDMVADAENNVAAVDAAVTDMAVGVESVAEDVRALTVATDAGLARVREMVVATRDEVQALAAQVGSLYSVLADIKRLVGG